MQFAKKVFIFGKQKVKNLQLNIFEYINPICCELTVIDLSMLWVHHINYYTVVALFILQRCCPKHYIKSVWATHIDQYTSVNMQNGL